MSQLPQTIHESWNVYLQPLFDDPKMEMIKDKCKEHPYFPSPEQVFRVFEMPIDKIKVVILGQDPYFKGEAIGLSFAVDNNITIPTSLRIILNEISKTIPTTAIEAIKRSRNLQYLVDQGVFLLNSALTVQAGVAGSHTDYWIWFTRQVVDIISKNNNPVWLLWGSKAQGFRSYIYNSWIMNIPIIETIKDTTSNYVLQAPHPAAESYDPDTIYKFSDCNHFNLCNSILILKGQTQINW